MYFDECLTPREVADIWDINESTIRKAIAAGRLQIGEDCQKFGKQWVLNIEAACRLWGTSPLAGRSNKSPLWHIPEDRVTQLLLKYRL